MTSPKKDTQIVILAAGKGRRMRMDGLPKVMAQFAGRPILEHVLRAVQESGVDANPVLVVGHSREIIEKRFGKHYRIVRQDELGGTGHAVQCCQATLKDQCQRVLVLYGDMPLVTPATIQKIAAAQRENGSVIAMAIIQVADFQDWRASLADYGRIVRGPAGNLQRICEVRDASSEILAIREVNPSFLCFDSSWLWNALGRLQRNNAQQELYLTDLVGIAVTAGERIATIEINPRDGLGVNTPQQLRVAERFFGQEGSL